MWCAGRQQKNIALFDGYVYNLSVFHNLEQHIAFQLIEKLFGFIVMKIFSFIWASNHHHHEILIALINNLIHYRWLK